MTPPQLARLRRQAARLAAVATLALAGACAGGTSLEGPPGPAGGPGETFGAGGTETGCDAGALFCSGAGLWRCSRSGLGAVLVSDCAARGLTTNAGVCTGDQRCAPGEAACCAYERPSCAWNVISPVSAQGQAAGGTAPASSSCFPPTAPVVVTPDACGVTGPQRPPNPYLFFSTTLSQCPARSASLFLGLDRASLAPGPTPIALPSTGASLTASDGSSSLARVTCSGSVTWHADLPSWRVTLNATCTDGVTPAFAVAGEFSGDI